MILIKKCFYNDFHFVATPLIAYNVGIIRSFSRAERLKGVTPEKNLGVEEGAT